MALAGIGIGSNLGDKSRNVEKAIEKLARLGTVVARSSLYATHPWGFADQPDFVNAAVLLETALSPQELMNGLKTIESELGRQESFRFGPRAIDLDILTFGDLRICEPGLTIPHARLLERAFALAPLAEIDPSYRDAYERLPATEREGVRTLGRG